MGYRDFTELPVWQAARNYKLAIYALCATGPLSKDPDLRGQLRRAAAKPPAHLAEAYARFNPADAARLATIAKAELAETQNHLIDAADQHFITEAIRREHHAMAQGVIDQIEGWRIYLQSPEAMRNVRDIRSRAVRRKRNPTPDTTVNPRANRNPPENPNPNPNPNPKMNSNPNPESESESEY